MGGEGGEEGGRDTMPWRGAMRVIDGIAAVSCTCRFYFFDRRCRNLSMPISR